MDQELIFHSSNKRLSAREGWNKLFYLGLYVTLTLCTSQDNCQRE